MTSSIYAIPDNLHNHGVITSITVDTPGSGYTVAPITITGDGVGATAEAVIRGTINSIVVTDAGNADYQIDSTTVTVDRNGGPAGVDATTDVTIFGFIIQENFFLQNGGTGFSQGTTISIDGPDLTGGRGCKARLTIKKGTISAITVVEAGTGYSSVPSFTLENTGGGSGENIIIQNIQGSMFDVTVTNAGANTNYDSDKAVAVINSSGNGAEVEIDELEGVIEAITVTNGGQDYTSASVTIGGDGAGATATANIATQIPLDTDILQNDITITKDQVSPGGGGILRIYFGIKFNTSPATISVFNDGNLKGNFNADNNAEVITDGYYRFDVDVEEDDKINFQSSQNIDGVNFFRSHLVQFGA